MSEPETTDSRSEKEVFFAALEQATPEARAACLERACGRDLPLRRRVEALLAKHFQDDSFLREPAVESSPTAVLPVPPSEVAGAVIGRYRLLEKLGEGGFGAVYVAEQKEPVKRRVALKIIKLGMDTRQVVARFEAERQALALMDHPHIARVLDAGATEAGRPYFVMELVRGVPITDYCNGNHLPISKRLDLFIAVCHAIQHAHQKGIIHRDIKPSNILVTRQDGVPVPKVIDFGIAKATQGDLTDKTIYTRFHQFIGTPAYISPEQAEMGSVDLDTRSDIYSLGVVLYELLTTKTPIDAEAMMRAGLDGLRRTLREQDPPRPSTRLSTLAGVEALGVAKHHSAPPDKLAALIRGDLDWIVMKCLEKDRTRRYETADGLAADLDRHLHHEPVLARPPSTLYRLEKAIRRHRRMAAAVGAVVLALVFGLGLATVAFLRERQARLNQTAAETARREETIRADGVGKFMDQILGTTAPELLMQGHQRPVRDLLKAANQLASTALSSAPAVELQLRSRMSMLYLGDGPSLLDSAASYEQVKRIAELLPSVPDDKLPIPRDGFRIGAARSSLWAGRVEEGLAELQALEGEFRNRTPPDRLNTVWCLAVEGNWRLWKGEAAAAEEKLSAALRLAPGDTPRELVCFIRGDLARALSDRGAAAEAERIAREGLLPLRQVTPDQAGQHYWLLRELMGALSSQMRFDEAESLLLEHTRELTAGGCPPRILHLLEREHCQILARAGKAREALPVLMAVAAGELATAQDCVDAACVAVGSGDLEAYRRLCALGLARFAAGAEGVAALGLAEMLLAAPQDGLVIQVAADLVERVERARDFSRDWGSGIREWLEVRKGNAAEGAALWPKAAGLTLPTAPIIARLSKSDYPEALIGFRSALSFGLLGRAEEAQQAYAAGLKGLGDPPSGEHRRDLGDGYKRWYLAEAHRREAEQVLKEKGIAVPARTPPAK